MTHNTVAPHKGSLYYEDQLIESLDKALALTIVFRSSSLLDYSEYVLQGYLAALSDSIQAAIEALQFLKEKNAL